MTKCFTILATLIAVAFVPAAYAAKKTKPGPVSPVVLRRAIRRAKGGQKPLKLLARGDGITQTYSVDYHGGLRYPHLVRSSNQPNYLRNILKTKNAGT